MPYRVRFPDLDAHHLKATRNPSQTSVYLKTTEKISQQSAEAPEQEQSALAETSFVKSVDQRHLLGIGRHQTDGYEPAMEKQATKEEIPAEKGVKSRKPYIPKHLKREVNKVELEGFHKRVKRVPKDMSFEDAYHKYRLGNFFRESRETDKDIELLFNKVSRKPKRTLKKEQDPGKFLIPCSIYSHHLPNALCDTGSAATKEEIPAEKGVKSRKPYIPKHLKREVNKVELEGFHKRVKRVPKDMSFEDAYHKYRLGNFFRESRETDKDIELLFNKVSRKPKRTLKKEQDPGKFLIPCSIYSHHLPNALCDTGSAVSIVAIDTAEILRLKMKPSKDSFTFVDSSRVNSASMIKNVKVEIGECIIPVEFHAMDIKSGKTSPLLFGRAFMVTVGAVCDLKRNKMCLTNIDETVFYDPMEKKKSEELISCIEMFEDP
ncbi:hypothetical protein F2Q69_00022814 [Brassica cretica]|uniref:Aspartic peptidase DDI1-type domain-containing protein n=1 Tax=Brassica cretica TaxID=69181 RepID=A0A8S9QFC4_BRACR|nr:hypothetical protein F2Q69_00022814 [Brassica cretica]